MVNVDWASELPIQWEVKDHPLHGYHRVAGTLNIPDHSPLFHLVVFGPDNCDPFWLVRAKLYIADFFKGVLAQERDPPRPA